MKHYLSDAKLSEYKNKLLSSKAQSLSSIENKSLEIREKMAETGDVIDIASEHEKYLSAKREIERLRINIRTIDKVLSEIEDYGYCTDCGVEIGEPRLNIDAAYQLCIDCAEIQEQKNRLYSK